MIQEETSKSPIFKMAEKWVKDDEYSRSAIVVLAEYKSDDKGNLCYKIDPLICGEDFLLFIGMAGAFIHAPRLSNLAQRAQEKAMAIVMGRDDDVF
jgi:hypothetical protein